MGSNGENFHVPNENLDGQGEEDDGFGEFEGFEGGVERMQAQAAPSPWATFPDLLPVQSSPATPAEDGQASTSRNAGPPPRDAWQAPPSPGLQWNENPIPNQQDVPQLPRTLNPPDVSLGTNQAVLGRLSPDQGHHAELGRIMPNYAHDAAFADVMDLLENGLEARAPVLQVDRLHQQLEEAEQGRVRLEEQMDALRQRNVELEQQVASGQAQINDLSIRLQQNQERLEDRLTEMKELNSGDWKEDLKQIQEEIKAIKESQTVGRTELEISRTSMEETRTGICNRLQNLESNIQRDYAEMEKRLLNRFDEQSHQVNAAIESIVQKTSDQISGNLSRIVSDAVLCTNGGDHQNNGLLQSIKSELEKHTDQQKKFLEEERQRQLSTVSSALHSALQHLSRAIDEESKDNKKAS